MFTLNPLPPQLSPALVDKLVRAEPATIGHFRHWGFMDPGIKALQPDVRIAGPAVTVHQPGVDGTIIGYALGQLRPGDILVVDRCGDTRHAGFGGVVCYAAKVAKVAGVIIDGMVADVARFAATACRCGAAAFPRSLPSASAWQARSAFRCHAVALRFAPVTSSSPTRSASW